MNKRTFFLSIILLTSFGLYASDGGSSSSSSAASPAELEEKREVVEFPQIEITADDSDADDYSDADNDTSFSIVQWVKDRTKVQFGGFFAALTVGSYGIYKLWARINHANEDVREEVQLLAKRDHDILVAFSDAMIADVERLKEGGEVSSSTELFDFSEMENKQMMQEGEIVKRTFVYLYNECKEDADKIEALEGLTATLQQDIVDMPVAA